MGDRPSKLTVGSFPYRPGFNPYQRLFTEALESAGLEVRRIPPTKWFPLSHACRQPVDVLHLDWHHDWYRGKNRVTQLMKRVMYQRGLRACSRLPVVWTAHNLESHDSANPRYDHDMTQNLIDVCRGVMVMSDASEALLRSKFAISESLQVLKVYHGHYIDCYKNEITRNAARKQLGIGLDEFVYLNFGSMRPYKGHLDLIRAFGLIASSSDRLLLAGGASRTDYQDQIEQAVHEHSLGKRRGHINLFSKQIPNEEIQLYFRSADVCILPFKEILNSGSLLLAMSFGKPVVAPEIGSIPEVAHPNSFLGYNAADKMGLADALRRAREMFTDPTIEEKILDFTRREYNWEYAGKQLRNFYSKLLNV